MLTDSTALVIQRRMKRVIFRVLSRIDAWISGLGRPPDDVANRYRLWNQAGLEGAGGHALLCRDDVVGDRAHDKRRAVGGDGLYIEGNASDGAQPLCHFIAVLLG